MKMSQAEFEAQLADIRKAYISSLKEKRDTISSKWATLSREWDKESYDSLYLVIHSLAGSAQTFDLDDITHHARSVIQQFKQEVKQDSMPAACVPQINDSIALLVNEINRVLGSK